MTDRDVQVEVSADGDGQRLVGLSSDGVTALGSIDADRLTPTERPAMLPPTTGRGPVYLAGFCLVGLVLIFAFLAITS